MGFPIMVDQVNQLGMSAVPRTLAIDEFGIIRAGPLRLDAADSLQSDFLDADFQDEGKFESRSATVPPNLDSLRAATQAGGDDGAAWHQLAVALLIWGDATSLTESIDAYHQACRRSPGAGAIRFGLGVAYRQRHDSPGRQPGDFQLAVDAWKAALDLDPNQYIWRRRIQQYGPRLDKPYPFYDWVPQAREEILSRGGQPVALPVEPRGSEFADAQVEFQPHSEAAEPDPTGRIAADTTGLIAAEVSLVPPAVAPGEVARVHIALRPTGDAAHWNNEGEDLCLWIDPPAKWLVDRHSASIANPPHAESTEERTLEFEIRCPDDATVGDVSCDAYALYYVCEKRGGTCLFRRQDLRITLRVEAARS